MIKNLAQAQFFLKNLAQLLSNLTKLFLTSLAKLLSSNKTFIPKKGVFKYD
jgi:hypothetical protein